MRAVGSIRQLFTTLEAVNNYYTICSSTDNISSEAKLGYHSLPSVGQIQIDKSVYDVSTMRGSGPGGQGTNSSSSKVQIKVHLDKLNEYFDSSIICALRSQEENRSITSDGSTLIVSCHEHRSAYHNEQSAIQKVKELLYKASYVAPPPLEPVKQSLRVIEQHKVARWKKSNYNRMRQRARKGEW